MMGVWHRRCQDLEEKIEKLIPQGDRRPMYESSMPKHELEVEMTKGVACLIEGKSVPHAKFSTLSLEDRRHPLKVLGKKNEQCTKCSRPNYKRGMH